MPAINPDQLERDADDLLNQMLSPVTENKETDIAEEQRADDHQRRQIDSLMQDNILLNAKLAEARINAIPHQEEALTHATDAVEFQEIEAIADDYPSLVNPILKSLKTIHRAVSQQSEKIASVRSVHDRIAEEAHFAAIQKTHPDMSQIHQSEDFQGWLMRQPVAIQQISQEGTAQDVIWMLDQYKAAVGKPRQKEIEKKTKFTRAQIAAMPLKVFEKHEAEIDAAIANGEIV